MEEKTPVKSCDVGFKWEVMNSWFLTFIYIKTNIHVCMYTLKYLSLRDVYNCVYTYMCTHIHICVYICVYVYIHVYMCL